MFADEQYARSQQPQPFQRTGHIGDKDAAGREHAPVLITASTTSEVYLLRDTAEALADQAHIDIARVRIGPVDFGDASKVATRG